MKIFLDDLKNMRQESLSKMRSNQRHVKIGWHVIRILW